MTYLRSVPSDLTDEALPPIPVGALVLSAVRSLGRGPQALLRRAQQRSEMRRARSELLELDDRLLRDIGLTRADVHSGNLTTKGELR